MAVVHLDPIFVGLGRSLLASLVAIPFLILSGAPRPDRGQLLRLAVTAGGVIVGFPALTSWAMRHVPSAHGAIVVGLLPLATAVMGAWLHHERPSAGFWVAAFAGSALVVAFAAFNGGGSLHLADLALFAAIVLGALGYAQGALLTRQLGGRATISWALALSAPFLLLPVGFAATRSDFAAAGWPEWTAFVYLALFSQYLGFFAWYKGLDLGGVARVSQVQLLQPFITFALAAFFNDETITLPILLFAAAVVATVAISTRTRGRETPVAGARQP